MESPFDPSPYTRVPQQTVPGAIALAAKLLALTPADAPPAVNRAARRVRVRSGELSAKWQARDTATPSPRDPRPVDLRNDRLWSAVHGRLDALDGVDPADVPEAKRAVELRDIVFPRGLTFLKLPYAEQWAEGSTILARIDADPALLRDLTAHAGAALIAALRDSHAAYGEMVGVTRQRTDAAPAPTPERLAGPLRALNDAIAAYTLQLAAMRADDPSTADAVARALAPIDELRARAARSTSGNGGKAPPADPNATTADPARAPAPGSDSQ